MGDGVMADLICLQFFYLQSFCRKNACWGTSLMSRCRACATTTRREVRMPFVGTVMAKQSQSFGDVSPKSALPLPDAVKVK